MKLDDLNHKLNLELTSEDYDSVGGWVIDRLEHLPAQGEEVEWEGVRLVVEQVEKNRIDKIHIYLPENEEKGRD
jgi:CBS domain containing-hemolysin-like protein